MNHFEKLRRNCVWMRSFEWTRVVWIQHRLAFTQVLCPTETSNFFLLVCFVGVLENIWENGSIHHSLLILFYSFYCVHAGIISASMLCNNRNSRKSFDLWTQRKWNFFFQHLLLLLLFTVYSPLNYLKIPLCCV